MATKKQKRAAALAKREEFMAEERRRGLESLNASRANDKNKGLGDNKALKDLLQLTAN